MPLTPNNKLLVDSLQSLPLLGNRFESIRLVNVDPANGVKRGCFSLVFRALDRDTGRNVALKFFDLDKLYDLYRLRSFEREHEILATLLNKHRCLQLVSALNQYDLPIDDSSGRSIANLSCRYFAVEWIDESVDHFFLRSESIDPIDRLSLFRELLLAIEALHRNEVFHRDIKPDNIRTYQEADSRIAVAIDLGTAARFSSDPYHTEYLHSVGAPAYAAPEALGGLAGNRSLGRSADTYAAGCLLFELFNRDYFFYEFRKRNRTVDAIIGAMATSVAGLTTETERIIAWQNALSRHAKGIAPVTIDCDSHSVPIAIVPLLNDVLQRLTHFDYRSRTTDLAWVRAKVRSAILVLQNERLQARKIELARIERHRREDRVAKRVARLADDLTRGVRRYD